MYKLFHDKIVWALLILSVKKLASRQTDEMSKFEIVATELGNVRGIKKLSALDTSFTAFLGIPYAIAPTGELRFKVSKIVIIFAI